MVRAWKTASVKMTRSGSARGSAEKLVVASKACLSFRGTCLMRCFVLTAVFEKKNSEEVHTLFVTKSLDALWVAN